MWTSIFRGNFIFRRARQAWAVFHVRTHVPCDAVSDGAGDQFRRNRVQQHASQCTQSGIFKAQQDVGQRGCFSCGPAELHPRDKEIDFADIARLKRAIDTTGSPNDSNMFTIARVIMNLGRLAAKDPVGFNYKTALQMATVNGSRALGILDRVGSLVPGNRADLILVRTASLNMNPAPMAEH